MDIEKIAEACYEANRLYCGMIGDEVTAPWDEAPDWQRETVIEGVEKCLGNDDWSPEQSHESWLAKKRADGWRYGPSKTEGLKQHPCMVSYDVLPAEQKVKDIIFVTVARTLGAIEA